LDQIAAQTNSRPGNVAIAWLLARPAVTTPIASATSLAQLQDLVAACALRLDPAQIATLNQASA
jgi:aryl-alcohol dehydrogenase-like predicted oxidoreductase